jgi:four helix bundle protein
VGAQRLEDLVAWQFANDFKKCVYRLVAGSHGAMADLRFRDQARSAAASVSMNVAEGFYRYRPREFARFLTIALGSLGEATLWVKDGVDRGHYTAEACAEALRAAGQCRIATLRLLQTLRRR